MLLKFEYIVIYFSLKEVTIETFLFELIVTIANFFCSIICIRLVVSNVLKIFKDEKRYFKS